MYVDVGGNVATHRPREDGAAVDLVVNAVGPRGTYTYETVECV